MASYRVDRTDKVTAWAGGQHHHVEALCVEGGRRIPKTTAIANINYGIESYYTYADGMRADVEVAGRCGACANEYLRTNRDTTTRNNLLELPDC